MKKLFVGLFVAAFMAVGLVVSVPTGAGADEPCPYTGCVATNTKIQAPNKVRKGNSAKVCVTVKSRSGAANPRGRVTVKVVRSKGGFSFLDSKPYNGRQVCFNTGKLKKIGRYVVRAKFDRRPGSGFLDSDNTAAFTVVKKRR